jgi:hypothetical protein
VNIEIMAAQICSLATVRVQPVLKGVGVVA